MRRTLIPLALITLGLWTASAYAVTDGRILYDRGYKLHTIKPNGHGDTMIRKHAFCADWSPSGKFIAAQTAPKHGHSQIEILKSNGHRVRLVTHAKKDSSCPDWSPSGKSLTFVRFNSSPADGGDIWKVSRKGRHLHRLTHTGDANNFPAWSSRGIAFDGGGGVYLMRANGTNKHLLALDDPDLSSPIDISFDNSELAYVRGGDNELLTFSFAGGTSATPFTDEDLQFPYSAPSFAPRGTRIAYTLFDEDTDITSVNWTRVGDPALHAHDIAIGYYPDWGPG